MEITPSDLTARLVQVYDVDNEEDLAGRTPNSLRTLKRWKKQGFPQNVQAALALLLEAGLLRSPVGVDGEEEDRNLLLARLAANMAQLIEAHTLALKELGEVHARLVRLEEASSADQAQPSPSREATR